MTEQRHAAMAIHPLETDGTGHHDLLKRQQMVRRTRAILVVVALLLLIGAARTLYQRHANASALEKVAAEQSTQYVLTTTPTLPQKGQTLTLPGTLQGYVQASIAARVSGYLKRWTHDIGSRVKQGELLAEIETPEIDQQLAQAIAAREQAAASLALARSTAQRWEALRQKDVVAQQDLEERRNAVATATANLAAAEANVQRLRQMEGFKRVLAPFAGVVTRRNVDVGDLIDAGAGRVLFTMAQTDPLRIYVNVPQSYASRIQPGQPVIVTQAELQGQKFEGKVARTAGAIDIATRQMQVEIALPNPDGSLLPGAYVQVEVPLPPSKMLSVPENALLFRAEGTRVAIVDAQGKVHLQPVTLGRNYGGSIEVLSGLQGNEQLVLNPSDALAEGDTVTIAPPKAAAPEGAKPGKKEPA
ncbi:efflux RND transporter periplasmic adaptor subunit [Extensimonas perlucida]|uniref:efflux RND transporter periplasmic adaptor subunit n=1 Tax=Extensimonas perlucida TaxID=2590786 RepID=UPI00119C9872|nr:efflux RND transporter periplasmic adaptor subunit [Extensimonas perlucida]